MSFPIIQWFLEDDIAAEHVMVGLSITRDDLEVIAEVFPIALSLYTLYVKDITSLVHVSHFQCLKFTMVSKLIMGILNLMSLNLSLVHVLVLL